MLLHVLSRRSTECDVISDMPALYDYLRLDMAWERTERTRVLFLDARCRLIRDETMWTGTIDATPLYVREVARRALELGASSLVAVHNHPAGDPTPTRSDITRTDELCRATAALDISLIDHIIVAEEGHFSMRSAGLLDG
jgi:DNA repair protein RadC